jgi:histone arginine demethylase JMJD6
MVSFGRIESEIMSVMSVSKSQVAVKKPANTPQMVTRRKNVTKKEFRDEHLLPAIPVILEDAMRDSPMIYKWTPDLFAERFGDRQVVVSHNRNQKFYRMTLRNFVDHCHNVENTLQGGEQQPLYAHSMLLNRVMPELLQDFTIPDYFLPNWLRRWPLNRLIKDSFCSEKRSAVEVFLGPPGAGIGILHQDRYRTHAWISEIYGHKRVWLVSPEQSHLVYPKPEKPNESYIHSITSLDWDRFPNFAEAQVYIADLMPGDTLIVPSGWWHLAECITVSISMSSNFVNLTNFKKFRKDIAACQVLRKDGIGPFAENTVMTAHGLLCTLYDAVGSR